MYLFDVFQVCSVASTESDVSKQGVEDVVSEYTYRDDNVFPTR